MAPAPGQDPGHIPVGLTWSDYVEFLVASCGSLAAAAERLSARRGYKEDVATIERALRRLRTRGQASGGTWGPARSPSSVCSRKPTHERAGWGRTTRALPICRFRSVSSS